MMWSTSKQSRGMRDEAAMLVLVACPSRPAMLQGWYGQFRWRV